MEFLHSARKALTLRARWRPGGITAHSVCLHSRILIRWLVPKLSAKCDAARSSRYQARLHAFPDQIALELSWPAMIVRMSLPLAALRSMLRPV
jgi:hypothetical protein